jgi:predicted dehydrogenase
VDVRLVLQIRSPGGRYADPALPHPSHRLPAGVIHEFITHMAYLLLRFLPDWESVHAAWANHGDDALFKYDDLDALVVAGPAHGRIRFSCRQGPEAFDVTVRGTDGWARTDLFQPFLQVNRPRAGKLLSPVLNHVAGGLAMVSAGVGGFWNKVKGRTPYEGLGAFLDATYDALRTGGTPPVTESDMLAAAALVDTMVEQGGRR